MMAASSRNYSLRGFTLLELSIVLVIIAVIIGSVVITQSMIRDAQIRSVVGEMTRYIQNMKDFQDKYHALPGDFAGATALWGTASGGCPAGAGTGTQTCNGDGNGRIGNQSVASINGTYEEFRAWQHLANANMIETTVNGIAGAFYHTRTPGTNIPKSQLEGAGWGLTCVTPGDISGGVVVSQIPYNTGDIPPNHVLWLGGVSTDGTSNLQTPVLKVEEAESIDAKIDDGQPNTGKVIGQINATDPKCAVSTAVTGDYNLAFSGRVLCSLVFKTGF